jgi:hypothetical protein
MEQSLIGLPIASLDDPVAIGHVCRDSCLVTARAHGAKLAKNSPVFEGLDRRRGMRRPWLPNRRVM